MKTNETKAAKAKEEVTEVEEVTQEVVQETKKEVHVLSVVIPYVKNEAQGEELRHAITSIQRNFLDNHRIIVIGDSEDWFEGEEVIFIAHERTSKNPQIDVCQKMELAITSELVSRDFVWTNDDIYFVSPVMLADIQVLKCIGELNPDKFKGIYSQNLQNTMALLDSYKLPKNNFATHTPVVFNKERLACILDNLPEKETKGYLISSLYFNSQFPTTIPIQLDWRIDNWCLPVITENPDPTKFRELLAKKKFLNNAESGYSRFLMDELEMVLWQNPEEE